MKRFKKFLAVLLVFVFALNLFISIVKGASYTYTQLSGSSFKWMCNDYTNDGIFSLYSQGGSFGIPLQVSIFKMGGVDYTNALIYDNHTDGVIGSYNLIGFDIHYNRNVINSLSNFVGKTIEIKASFSGSYGGNNYSGSFYFKGVLNSDKTIGNTVLSDAPSFTLVYNNDYNYTSNKASFTMQYTNFTFNYFTLLNTDIKDGGALGGFHLLNYTISNNVVYCSFDNTYETMSNPHYLVYKVHGLDNSGNSLDFTGSVQFNINVDTSPKVKNYKVSYVMDGSPCLAGSGGGRLYLYIDYGSGYQLQDTSKWSVSISQIANGGQDTFSYAIDPNFNTAYKLSITKIDDIDTYNYSIHINDTGINLTGQLKVCSNDDYVFDNTGNETSGQETDIFTLLKEIKDIIIGFWNLLLSIIAFFGALFLAILNIVYSLGVAILSLLKIAFDFFASVSSIIFNRDTTYYSISTIANIPGSISYAGKNISLGGFLGQMDSVFRYIHDNIVLQYNGVWSLIAMIILIKRHLIKKDEDDND
jgi:hypothetical protein